jgi:hypothetical protein
MGDSEGQDRRRVQLRSLVTEQAVHPAPEKVKREPGTESCALDEKGR